MEDKETTNISSESNNNISTESKYQKETKIRPGRLGYNLSQKINTPISRGDLDQNGEENKSGKVGSPSRPKTYKSRKEFYPILCAVLQPL